MAEVIRIEVPDIGDYKEVDVVEVMVKPGDVVRVDDSLITLETEKASMEVPSPAAGVVREVLVHVGDKISEGTVIVVLAPDVPSTAVSKTPIATPPPPAATAAPVAVRPTPALLDDRESVAAATAAHLATAHASPSIRKFARDLGVDIAQVKGSGPKGRILQGDVAAYVKSALLRPGTAARRNDGERWLPWPEVDFEKFGPVERQALGKLRRASGANLARNWVMIPHVTQFDEADITDTEAFRKSIVAEYQAESVKLTLLAFLIKAAVAALRRYPEFNASLSGDELVLKRYFHIGFAADTPNGLVVPVLRDADTKPLLVIAAEAAALAAKARAGKLSPVEIQGGCFTISSLGGVGGTAFTPIINAPEVAILGVSKSVTKPVWNGNAFVPRLILPLSLSYDHRVIDGALAARFTTYLGQALQDVRRLML